MAPNFIDRIRARGIPADPPSDNPHEVAREQWDALRGYASKVASVAQEIDDDNKTLMAENESLRRENQRLSDELSKVSREHRATLAFAESLRTRLKSIAEQINAATSESLQYAHAALVREPPPKTPEEIAGAAAVIENISRLTPREQSSALPRVSWGNQ